MHTVKKMRLSLALLAFALAFGALVLIPSAIGYYRMSCNPLNTVCVVQECGLGGCEWTIYQWTTEGWRP